MSTFGGVSNFAKLKQGAIVLASGTVVFWTGMILTGHPRFYKNVVMPLGHTLLDAETAHLWTVKFAKWGLLPYIKPIHSDILKCSVLGHTFSSPIGLAAGFDKNGEAVDGMVKLGFSFVEIGSVTPEPQPGNPKPRVFRLSEDQAIINRYGFNSDGHNVVYERLKSHKTSHKKACVIGVNLGKNKNSNDAIGDYVQGIRTFGVIADYLVINVSSPNTPGLRGMQRRQVLEKLITASSKARDDLSCKKKPPLLVKIAPDLTEEEKKDIAYVVSQPGCGVDGLIISNTTVSRPESLISKHKTEVGGLSGMPLKSLSTDTIRDFYQITGGKVTIVGVGGVENGTDAYEKIKAGASLVQLYTALAFRGPPVASCIKKELEELLVKDGYTSVAEAVGADHKTL